MGNIWCKYLFSLFLSISFVNFWVFLLPGSMIVTTSRNKLWVWDLQEGVEAATISSRWAIDGWSWLFWWWPWWSWWWWSLVIPIIILNNLYAYMVPKHSNTGLFTNDVIRQSAKLHLSPPSFTKLQAKHRWIASQTYSRQKRVNQDKSMHACINGISTIPTIYMRFTVHCAVCSL